MLEERNVTVDLPPSLARLRVVLVHDWLVTWRGGERVLEALAELFPKAPIATLFYEPKSASKALQQRRMITSWLDAIPGARRRHRFFLPMMPAAISTLRFDADLVVSSSHCVAKGVWVPPGALHLSYVHATMRYMYERFDDYFGPKHATLPVRIAARLARPALQRWDRYSARTVDRFVANSAYIAGHIASRYGRSAAVVHPPVAVQRFAEGSFDQRRGDFFLFVGAFAPYKRLDLAIEATRLAGVPLLVVGPGHRVRSEAHVRFVGEVNSDELRGYYQQARALLFPGTEDFGLTPIEAQAAGCPVIALRSGGALETLSPHGGYYFDSPTPFALAGAIRTLDEFLVDYDPQKAWEHAMLFRPEVFRSGIVAELEALIASATQRPSKARERRSDGPSDIIDRPDPLDRS